jgi:hypothetical protein
MISLVNGYICKSWQDVTEALQGKKPPAKAGELPYSSGSDGKISAFPDRPAAHTDGFKELTSAQSGAPVSSSYAASPGDGQTPDQTSAVLQVPDSSQTSAAGVNLLV